MRYLMLLIAFLGIQLSPMPAQAVDTAATQAQAIRYIDLTTRADGWGASQLLAMKASMGKGVVIVSYLDPQQTRALYDEAERFMKKSAQPRVVGVIRSPGVPANVTQTAKNPLGFDVFFDGTAIPPMENPDARFTRTDQLDAFLRGIQRNHFAGQERK